MKVYLDREQMAAILGTRKTLSPGGAARAMGLSRQRIHQLADKHGKTSGVLAWLQPVGRRFGVECFFQYIDFGPHEKIEMDPKEWYGRDPQEILAESMRQYAEIWATRVR